jgi:SAM-dependent methyltransferase
VRACGVCASTNCDSDWSCGDCGNLPDVVAGFPAFAPELAAGNDGFREEFFAGLADLEAESWWFRARNELITWALRNDLPDSRSLLEIGCGTGYVLSGIHAARPEIQLAGSEIFSAGLAFAATRVPSAAFYQIDARNIPFRDEFDVIGAFDVLEHIEDDVAVIEQVAKALRPGGGLLATVPQHPALWSAQDVHASHVRRYTARDLRRKVEAAGFEIVRLTSFVSLLLPMMFASRLRIGQGRGPAEFDPVEELRQPRALDRIFRVVMRIERGMIRRGIALPAGGSLLLVAKKPGALEAEAAT